jgi:hypothetical protein
MVLIGLTTFGLHFCALRNWLLEVDGLTQK